MQTYLYLLGEYYHSELMLCSLLLDHILLSGVPDGDDLSLWTPSLPRFRSGLQKLVSCSALELGFHWGGRGEPLMQHSCNVMPWWTPISLLAIAYCVDGRLLSSGCACHTQSLWFQQAIVSLCADCRFIDSFDECVP